MGLYVERTRLSEIIPNIVLDVSNKKKDRHSKGEVAHAIFLLTLAVVVG